MIICTRGVKIIFISTSNVHCYSNSSTLQFLLLACYSTFLTSDSDLYSIATAVLHVQQHVTNSYNTLIYCVPVLLMAVAQWQPISPLIPIIGSPLII